MPLAAEEFPDAKKNLFGDGFEERLETRSETAKTLFLAANSRKNTVFFFEAAPPLFRSRGYRRGSAFQGAPQNRFRRGFPALEGLRAGATNPMPPRTTNSKAGKGSFSSKYYWPEFKSKTVEHNSFAPSEQSKTLSFKLTINMQRPLGLTSYTRLSNRLHKPSMSHKAPSGYYSHPEGKLFNRE